MEEGCPHYKRGCEYLSPCCTRFFGCRLCHDIVMYETNQDRAAKHKLNRHEVKQVKCYRCKTVQVSSQQCVECNLLFGAYFCAICNFFDNDLTNKTFHCEDCGACRRGNREDFFHCTTCGGCFSSHNAHTCLEGRFMDSCSVCREDLFFSRKPCKLLRCRHIIHNLCFRRLLKAKIYKCPLCSTSLTASGR